jgi:hypothetical protein
MCKLYIGKYPALHQVGKMLASVIFGGGGDMIRRKRKRGKYQCKRKEEER